jgi:uncharacterized glyoxalase superfamily protein PhnB
MNISFKPRYVLAVNKLEASVEYYKSILGLVEISRYPGWVFLSRDNFIIMLGECPDVIPAKESGDHSYFAYVEVDDAKALYHELNGNGAEFIKSLIEEPWGMREFGVRTIDGHRIMFGQSLTA